MATTQQRTRTIWKIDPAHTLVEFAVKHMMVTTVKGRFTDFQGQITGSLDDLKDVAVDVTIQAKSVNTGSDDRDTHLRSGDFLDVEQFPTITFKSTRVESKGKDHAKVYGDLTVRGTTREVELDTEINGVGKNPYGQEVVGFSAETSISRKEWGLTWNVALESGGWLVADRLKITIEGQATKQEA